MKKQNAKICNFEGLTEKQTKYVIYRMSGIGKEEAKVKAGYSEKTKTANIERSPKIAKTMLELREVLFQDTELGAFSIASKLGKVINMAMEGAEVVEYVDESGPDGHTINKRVRKDKPLIAAVGAAREINLMLGYRVVDEAKLRATINSKNDTAVSDEDFE
ncbi:hypothetical protein LC565_08305 [Fusobacterium animalis]|uniref:hypothetical protein n=1 Tax=Fusobacterium animalis TaxID=76859 RepID=UPI0030CB3FAD